MLFDKPQKRIQNPVKDRRWSLRRQLNFSKSSGFDKVHTSKTSQNLIKISIETKSIKQDHVEGLHNKNYRTITLEKCPHNSTILSLGSVT